MQAFTEKPSDFSEKTPTLALIAPTIPVQGTPARWISHSQIVNMNTSHLPDDSSADEATSSLGDSTYDFIDDRSAVTTDDESQDGTAESINSFDGYEAQIPHDLSLQSDLATDEDVQAQRESNCIATTHSGPQSPTTPVLSAKGAPSDIRVVSHNDQDTIVFEESSIIGLGSSTLVQVSHTLGPLQSTEESSSSSSCLSGKENIVTVRQVMASHKLDLRGRSFKVLYVGHSGFRDVIIQKIATALAASKRSTFRKYDYPRPSKFNVVPITSFGDDRSPEVVLIDSSGVELEVEECKQATLHGSSEADDIIELTLADGTSLESESIGHKFVVSDDFWRLPDIVVFFATDKDDLIVRQTRHFSWLFMNRHSVRAIVIMGDPLLNEVSEAMTLDHLVPHICLEYPGNSDSKRRILRRMPVDLNTFLKIDACQMNRNLACLSNAKTIIQTKEVSCSQEQRHSNIKYKTPCERIRGSPTSLQSYYRLAQRTFNLAVAWSVIGLLLISFCLISIGDFNRGELISIAKNKDQAATLSTLASSVSQFPYLKATSTSLGSLEISKNFVPAQVSPDGSSSTDTDIASFLRHSSTQTPNKAERFKIHLLGDRHVVLRSPLWFIRLKKAPTVSFRISREGSVLEHSVSTLFEGVHALQIPREQAYGLVTVEIWTRTRPVIDETFEVDFGSSWLKIAAWKHATRAVSESIQSEFSQLRIRFITGFDKAKVNIFRNLHRDQELKAWQHVIEGASVARHLQSGARIRDLAVVQTKDLSRYLAWIFRSSTTATTEHVSLISKVFTRTLSVYAHTKTTILSQRVQVISRVITDMDLRTIMHKSCNFKLSPFRSAQKTALRTWWRIRGLPKRETVYRNKDGPYQSKRTSVFHCHE